MDQFCGEVEQFVEEVVPGQTTQDDQRRVAVRSKPTETKGPLGFQVRQNKRKVLYVRSEK